MNLFIQQDTCFAHSLTLANCFTHSFLIAKIIEKKKKYTKKYEEKNCAIEIRLRVLNNNK